MHAWGGSRGGAGRKVRVRECVRTWARGRGKVHAQLLPSIQGTSWANSDAEVAASRAHLTHTLTPACVPAYLCLVAEDDVVELARLQRLLCIPQDERDAVHAEQCGGIFKDAVNKALSAGIEVCI
jgi:hypothetical protein